MSQPIVSGIGHVGIVVPDMDAARELYTKKLGVPTTEPVELSGLSVKISFAELPNAKIEIICPLNMECEHGQFLKEHPKGGIHHICFTTPDLKASTDALANQGIETAMNDPLVLWNGDQVKFYNPDQTLGALFELCEAAKQ
ncbi:methylmalonyl-CoA epimerase [Histomonas meleagridis]|uniref:methylmalonyl-CoA epimerase n=1 Tax=Histomonas meleagridis TaxID=135588 RepID=UPI00355A6D8E|nr:methylmalonyl-CoA epimerase [Histomonas meleagridis]KAH0802238.1 methylmalonyl-CoA epimerase [Histomonas meleagridis]